MRLTLKIQASVLGCEAISDTVARAFQASCLFLPWTQGAPALACSPFSAGCMDGR